MICDKLKNNEFNSTHTHKKKGRRKIERKTV